MWGRARGVGAPGRTIDRRTFLRLCGVVAPALVLPTALAPPIAGAVSARRTQLAPPDAPRTPQRTSQGLVMAQTNPVVSDNCPDPGIMEDGGVFYMVSTTHVLPAFPIRRSTDLVHWEHTGRHVFTRDNRPRWARDHFWAPELHRVGGRYVAYFTARSTQTGRLCIGAATATAPEGPYTDTGQPLVSERVAVLDPTYFRDDDGRQYLYWKMDGPGSPAGPLCVQELRPDGLGFAGPRREIMRDDLGWEDTLIEAPSVVKRGGYYYLFYSGSALQHLRLRGGRCPVHLARRRLPEAGRADPAGQRTMEGPRPQRHRHVPGPGLHRLPRLGG